MFYGDEVRKIDSKNRVMIPAKFRKNLNEKIFLVMGPDNTLRLMNLDVYDLMLRKIKNVDKRKKETRESLRFFMRSTVELQTDSSGRIRITENFSKQLNLKTKEINFIGMDNYIEITIPIDEKNKNELIDNFYNNAEDFNF
ncbi:MAG: hypothetical protein K4H23_03580 [Mollicutes bacterium PWAP]|nr:hypothetical protein [Mollicutes bacterium PWAP]